MPTGSDAIHRHMPIHEIVTLVPEAKSVLAEYGLHCFSCAGSEYETLGEGCLGHGFSDEEVDGLVDDLNVMLNELPPRPQTLTLTADAARAIKTIAKDETVTVDTRKKTPDPGSGVAADFNRGYPVEEHPRIHSGDGIGLAVIADAAGGFCMEFRPEPDRGDAVFRNAEEPSVRLFASNLTLKRIGGATVDFREGRFKLDLPEDALKLGCGCSENKATCKCKTHQIAE